MTDALAEFLFRRQAATYNATPTTIDEAWSDPAVRGFWQDEAAAIMRWFGARWGDVA